MFKNIRELFENTINAASGNTGAGNVSLELAAAVLMLEISLADSSIQDNERRIIRAAMIDIFHLSATEAGAIIDMAEQEVDHMVSLYEFTSLLNSKLSAEEKTRIVELLWQVAFADKILDKYEEYYIRKIADLLYVSHQDYIKAKHRMMRE